MCREIITYYYLWTHKHQLWLMFKNCVLSCNAYISLHTHSTYTLNECNNRCLSFPLRLTRLSEDRIRSVITSQPLFAADISVQLIMPILPSCTGQSVRVSTVWEGEREATWKDNMTCDSRLPGSLLWAPLHYMCVLFQKLRICMHYHVPLSVSKKIRNQSIITINALFCTYTLSSHNIRAG